MDFRTLILNWHRHFDHEVLDRFRDGLASYAASRKQEIVNDYDHASESGGVDEYEHQFYLSFLEDEAEFLDEIITMGDELAIIALHRNIELTRKSILKRSFPNLNERQLSNLDYIKNNVPFDITRLGGAAAVAELGLICNSINHQGKVSSELSRYPGWKEGGELQGLGDAYKRLAAESEKYITSLVDAIKACNENDA